MDKKNKKPRARKSRKRSLDSGLWFRLADGKTFEVKPNKISSAKLVPSIPTRYGIPNENGEVELLENATFAVYPENIEQVVLNDFIESGELDEEADNSIMQSIIKKVVARLEKHPSKYRKGKVDSNLVEHEEYEAYNVIGYNDDTGREILEPADYLIQTHAINEKDPTTGKLCILPRDTWDLWLADYLYELKPYDDAATIEGYKFAQKMNHYPIPNPETGEVEEQEVMLYTLGYVSKTGYDAQPRWAMIRPVFITDEKGEEKFVFEMKLCKTRILYQNAVPIPLPGEEAKILTAPQKSVKMQRLGDLASQLAAMQGK
jgi:hypothetical protein